MVLTLASYIVFAFRTEEEAQSYKFLGGNGYDNRLESMRTIFGAIGPDIAENKEIGPFQDIELYNLFASKFIVFKQAKILSGTKQPAREII